MRYLFVVICCFKFLTSVGQQVEVIKSKELFQILEHCEDENQILVFNFWATWCAPCIREIPQFESANRQNKNIDVTLISLDEVELSLIFIMN